MDNRYFGRLAAFLSVCAILMVGAHYSSLSAQQTGPGGVPSGNSGGGVPSVFGRTGAVVAANGDYTAAQVTNAAATNAANTFTANQKISAASLAALSVVTPGESIYFGNWDNDWFGFYSNTSTVSPMLWLDASATQIVQVPSTSRRCWASSQFNYQSSGDTGLTRTSAGVVAVGACGSPGDASGWLQSSAIGTGVSGNTDLRGHVTLVSGTGTYTFSRTYLVAPTCVATDSTTAAAVKVSSTITALTLNGTGTDVLNYVCAD